MGVTEATDLFTVEVPYFVDRNQQTDELVFRIPKHADQTGKIKIDLSVDTANDFYILERIGDGVAYYARNKPIGFGSSVTAATFDSAAALLKLTVTDSNGATDVVDTYLEEFHFETPIPDAALAEMMVPTERKPSFFGIGDSTEHERVLNENIPRIIMDAQLAGKRLLNKPFQKPVTDFGGRAIFNIVIGPEGRVFSAGLKICELAIPCSTLGSNSHPEKGKRAADKVVETFINAIWNLTFPATAEITMIEYPVFFESL